MTRSIFRILTNLTCVFLISSVGHAQQEEKKSATENAFLVQAGKGKAEIVIAPDAARATKLASRELQSYIEKISGAKLPIVNKPGGRGLATIYVGKSEFTDKLGLSTDGLRHGAFRIDSGKNWLALLGPDKDFVPIEPWGRKRGREESDRVNKEWDKTTGDTFWNNFNELYWRYDENLDVWDFDDKGTLNAVYEFLRLLGVRWFAPGEIGEVVPSLASIRIPDINRVFTPDFALRSLRFFYPRENFGETRLWMMRLGVNPGHDLIGITQPGHGIKFVMMRDEMKQAHPEMYALFNGQRETNHKQSGMSCLSSPVLFEKHVKFARAMFDHFQEPMLSVDMVDGFGAKISEVPESASQATPERGWAGSMSDYVWGYINRVALELHESHPDRMVSGLSYSAYQLPPEKIEMMSPNLAIIECRWRSNTGNENIRKTSQAIRDAWMEKLPSKMYFTWDYYLHGRPITAGPPVFFPRLIAQDLQDLKGVSSGDTIEVYNHPPNSEGQFSYDALAVNHLNLYATSKLWWDADLDVDAMLDDYYEKYYGPAAPQMKTFIEFSEANWPKMNRDAAAIEQSQKLLAEAQKAAPADSVYAKRMQMIADYMKPMEGRRKALLEGRKNVPEALAARRQIADFQLDGKFDEAFWKDVPKYSLSNIDGSGAPGQKSEFSFVIGDDGILYFAMRCEDSDMENLAIKTEKNEDVAVWSGDMVELLIETPSHSYYQIAIGPGGNGTLLDLDRSEGLKDSWTSKAEVAVHRGEDAWTIEGRIPAAGRMAFEIDPLIGISGDLPDAEEPWFINVCRQRIRGSDTRLTAWSPGGKFHNTSVFGKLQPEPAKE